MREKTQINIIYSVTVSSEEKYKELFKDSHNKPGQQSQKYHRLLISGLSSLEGVNIDVISKLPISRSNYKGIYIKKGFEKVKNANYFYIPILNIPIIKNIHSFIYLIIYLLSYKKRKNTVIISDVLNITTSIANLLFGRIKGIKTIGIVTDVPSYLSEIDNMKYKKNKLISKIVSDINSFILKQFDSYIFLTQQMNTLINKKNKPYIVMEGHVDVNMKLTENSLNEKYDKKVCMYTGSLKSIYGIKMLTEAFIKANIENSELHIYGSGDFENELIQISRANSNIKYFGVKLNDYIIKEQMKATLLINPRPTKEEYTKYSFPSKNMEYMASGTPVLTTKLPGMPKEYNEFVYLIEDETVEGLTKIIKELLNLPKETLHRKGLEGKKFVLKEKNNIIQSKKIIELMKKL